MLSGLAVAGASIAVAGVVALNDQEPAYGASAVTAPDTRPSPVAVADGTFSDRVNAASRSAARASIKAEEKKQREIKAEKKKQREQDSAERAAKAEAEANADPRGIARNMMPEFGFAASEFSCLDQLYVGESNWDMHADNPSSSAYGIPQAMMSAHELPADYTTNATTQIRWGLGYIRDSYGTPCAALDFKGSNNYY